MKNSANLNFVYIVRRESADGPEVDVFTDSDLADKWAEAIGSTVEEEGIIDEDTLKGMLETLPDNKDSNNEDEE